MLPNIIVSAIISTYNSEQFIEGKIIDLIDQTIINNLEIIIVNSGSEQNEDEIIKKYLKLHYNIKYIKTPNQETIYKAWNRAIKVAEGKFICNSNTDDRLRRDAYEIMSNYLEANHSVGLIYADQYYSNSPNQEFDSLKKIDKYPKPDYTKLLLLERCIIGSQPMWRKSIHDELNIWFDEKYEIAGDYEFELKLTDVYQIKHIPKYLGVYFKSLEQSNKEFQSFEKTFNETVEIMTIYLKKFIHSNDQKIIYRYFILFRAMKFLPKKIYSAAKVILRKFYPRKEIPSYEFLVWYISFVFEQRGDIEQAIKVCYNFIKGSHSHLINFRLKQLATIKD